MPSKLIIASVKPDYSDKVVDAAKSSGATGATILPGRGTGLHEASTFFGLTLDARTDVIFFLLDAEQVQPVLNAISEVGKFTKPGTGIAFVLPIEQAIGMESQMKGMKQ